MWVINALLLSITFLPAPVQAIILGTIAVLLVIAVFKLIALVLDVIPFL